MRDSDGGDDDAARIVLLENATVSHVARLNSRSSQILFESSVVLYLTADQQRRVFQLDFFKRWYLLCHALYILLWCLVACWCFYMLEPSLPLIDAFFLAVSSICNCGLQTIDVGNWSHRTTLLRHLLLLPGGVVLTSAFQPLLRLFLLRRVRDVFRRNTMDSPREAALRLTKRVEARRLFYTSLVCATTSFVYLGVVNILLVLILYVANTSQLDFFDSFCMTIASFHSSIFLPMEQYARDPVVTGVVVAACALGFTGYPVVLRGFMWLEWRLMVLIERCWTWAAYCLHRWAERSSAALLGAALSSDVDGGDDAAVADEQTTLLIPLPQRYFADIDAAFQEILHSSEPGSFHPFLFRNSETVYLGVAWWSLTLMQAVPFWFEQWDGVLSGLSSASKIYVALCQAGVVRFAAASFLPLLEFSNAHIAVIILAMYLPALPISTDRTYRKWKEMFQTSVMRLLMSRLFWLFAGMVLILFAEEHEMRQRVLHSPFDVMTRTFFEVISAYAGCGLSLSLGSSPVSFTGAAGSLSKLTIAAIIFGGRHRFVDLGIDLGFASLRSQVQLAAENDAASAFYGNRSETEEDPNLLVIAEHHISP